MENTRSTETVRLWFSEKSSGENFQISVSGGIPSWAATSRWDLKILCGFRYYFHPYLGKWSNLTNIFQLGWNHQLEWYDAIGDTVGRKLCIRCMKPGKHGRSSMSTRISEPWTELFDMTWNCVVGCVRMQDEAMRMRWDQCVNCVLTMNNNQLATSN